MLRRRRRPAGYSLLDEGGRRELLEAYARLMKQIRKEIVPRGAGETVDQYFARVAREHPFAWRELAWLRDRLNEAAYRPVGMSIEDIEDARSRMAGIGESIHSGAGA